MLLPVGRPCDDRLITPEEGPIPEEREDCWLRTVEPPEVGRGWLFLFLAVSPLVLTGVTRTDEPDDFELLCEAVA